MLLALSITPEPNASCSEPWMPMASTLFGDRAFLDKPAHVHYAGLD